MTNLTFTTEYIEETLTANRASHWENPLGPTLLLHLEDDTYHQVDVAVDDPMLALLPDFMIGMVVAKEVQQTTLRFRSAMCDVIEALFVVEGQWQHSGDDCDCGIDKPNCLNGIVVRPDGTFDVVQVPCDPDTQSFSEAIVRSNDMEAVSGHSAMLTAALIIAVADMDPQTMEVIPELRADLEAARAAAQASGNPEQFLHGGGLVPCDKDGNPQFPEPEHVQPDAVIQPLGNVVSLQDYFTRDEL